MNIANYDVIDILTGEVYATFYNKQSFEQYLAKVEPKVRRIDVPDSRTMQVYIQQYVAENGQL